MTACPRVVSTVRRSLRTGTTSPSDVADNATPSRTGSLTQPAACSPTPIAEPAPSDTTYPDAASSRTRPRSRSTSTSRPARKSSMARPRRPTICTARSSRSQPATCGPRTTPRTISRTTAGSRSQGTSPTARGARSATASTPRRLVNEMSGIGIPFLVVPPPVHECRAPLPWGRTGRSAGGKCRTPSVALQARSRVTDRGSRATGARDLRRGTEPSGGTAHAGRRRLKVTVPLTTRT